MIKVNCEVEQYDENLFDTSAEFKLSDEATTDDAITMFVKALELDGYADLSIAKSLYMKCEELCNNMKCSINDMLEFYNKVDEEFDNY